MTPYIFRNNDSRKATEQCSSVRLTLRFTGRHIFPSQLLAEFLDIHAGSYVTFMLDQDNPSHVYIRKANDGDEWTAKVSSMEREKKLQMSASAVVKHILSITDATKTCTLFVSPKPVIVMDKRKKYYRIITEKPYAIK